MSTRHLMDSSYTPPDFANKSWRSFGMDTEAGRLLNKLYAGSQQKPTINYPPVRVRKQKEGQQKPTFIPGGGNSNVNPRLKQRKDTSSLYVPKVGRGPKAKKTHAIDRISRRKTKDTIFNKRSEDEVERMRYRPPLQRPIATESNKRLLQATFQFKGGKCLPETGTMQPIEGHLPLQLVTGKLSHAKARKNLKEQNLKEKENKIDEEHAKLLEMEKEFEEIMDEIDDRKKFLDEMVQFGKKELDKHKNEVMAQIGDLVRRAKDLDKKIKKTVNA
jgi:hypothetical protein